jgi:hypothetical protein
LTSMLDIELRMVKSRQQCKDLKVHWLLKEADEAIANGAAVQATASQRSS